MSDYRIVSETNTITKAIRWVVEDHYQPYSGADMGPEIVGICDTEEEAEELIVDRRVAVAWVRDE